MEDPLKGFTRWQKRLPEPGKFLGERLMVELEAMLAPAGFRYVKFGLGDKEFVIPPTNLRLERRSGDDIDFIAAGLDKYGAPRFSIVFGRRGSEPPQPWRRGGTLIARKGEYYHQWGKPWWWPTRCWSPRSSEAAIRAALASMDQVLVFLENGDCGPNIYASQIRL